MEIAVKNS